MKYIIIEAAGGLPAAVLFHEALNHAAIAGGRHVLGAGFCDANGNVWGESVSLGIKSARGDSDYVRQAISFRRVL